VTLRDVTVASADALLVLENVLGLRLVDVTVAGERIDDLAGSAAAGEAPR
jgi:hypothetical protein